MMIDRYSKLIRMLLLFLTMVLLLSCVSNPRRHNEPLLIADDLFFQLLPSNVFAEASSVTQEVTISYQGKQNTFISRVEVDQRGIVVVAMTQLGQTIFTLQYQDDQLHINKAVMLLRMPDLKFLLGDLQLIFWPYALLQDQLNSASIELLESKDAGVLRSRSIQRVGKALIDIEYSGGVGFESNVLFTHHERNYTIQANILALD